jgi:hypothetical protein
MQKPTNNAYAASLVIGGGSFGGMGVSVASQTATQTSSVKGKGEAVTKKFDWKTSRAPERTSNDRNYAEAVKRRVESEGQVVKELTKPMGEFDCLCEKECGCHCSTESETVEQKELGSKK